ncbi:MAG: hypothetical protein ACE5NW_00170 [Acidiferrobacterales bacterium]
MDRRDNLHPPGPGYDAWQPTSGVVVARYSVPFLATRKNVRSRENRKEIVREGQGDLFSPVTSFGRLLCEPIPTRESGILTLTAIGDPLAFYGKCKEVTDALILFA